MLAQPFHGELSFEGLVGRPLHAPHNEQVKQTKREGKKG